MKFVHEAILKKFPHFNKRIHTFDDVETYIRRHHINLKICEYKPDILGYYCIRRTAKRRFRWIIINSILHRLIRTYTGLHEIGHDLLNPPTSARVWRYCRLTAKRCESKHDAQADYFALIAMIPTHEFLELAGTAFEDIPEEMMWIITKRQALWDQYQV